MTILEIDELKAGPELDALIAEKVMGWEYLPHRLDQGWPWKVQDGVRATKCPKYSTQMTSAWEVAEKISREQFSIEFRLVSMPSPPHEQDVWRVFILTNADKTICGEGTAPLAICRAALNLVNENFYDE